MTDDEVAELRRVAYARPDANTAATVAAQRRLRELAEVPAPAPPPHTEPPFRNDGDSADLGQIQVENGDFGPKLRHFGRGTGAGLGPLPSLRAKVAVGIAAVAAAALACAAVSLGHPSLEVFSRTQTGAPQWPGATQGDSRIRWLASSSGWDIYGLITEGGNICLTSFDAGASGGGSCTSRSEFEQSGLALGTSRVTDVGTTYLSIRWGPLGGARVYPVPLDQAPTS